MKKFTILFIAVFVLSATSFAQTVEKKWGFGAGAGAYLNTATSTIGFVPGAYLSRYLSPSFDIMANISIGYFGNQNINEPLDMFSPALNLRYKLFNGYIMPVDSKFQPYLYGGVGYMFDNAKSAPNYKFGGGVKYPLSKTFSLFAEAGYNHGIDSERVSATGTAVAVHDNFVQLIGGIEISFIRQSDSDKDGVVDPLDQCPDTPKGAVVDENGCPRDTDKDGVFDGIDECPNTEFGVAVDEKGCALDTDKDGVPDSKDDCPDTPKRVKVDEKGCPIDTDKDGVYDEKDKCPETPVGTEVDEDGCPIDVDQDNDGVLDSEDECPDTPEGLPVNKVGCIDHSANIDLLNDRLFPIYFDTDVHKVTNAQDTKVDNLVQILEKYPEYNVNLYGHADHRGTAAYNKALSQRRVDDVVELLKQKGVSDDRIRTKAFGEDQAEQGDLTEEELQENRKVASYIYMVISD